MDLEVDRPRVLVTGADGFTGKLLLTELEEGGFSSLEISNGFSREADLLDKSSLSDFFSTHHPDHVIHLAAISNPMHPDQEELWSVNVTGTENLLVALEKSHAPVKKFVLASSSAVYAQSSEAISEQNPLDPKTIYAESKLAAEEVCLRYSGLFDVGIVRPFNYTGLGQSESFFVPKIIGALKRNDPTLTVGNLSVERDFSDVRDIVRYYGAIMQSPSSRGIYNLCSGSSHSLSDLVQLGIELSGASTKFVSDQSLLRSSDNQVVLGSNQRLQDTFGVGPAHSLKDTLAWMLSE